MSLEIIATQTVLSAIENVGYKLMKLEVQDKNRVSRVVINLNLPKEYTV